MHIAIVSSAFAPFLDSTRPQAEPAAALAKALVLQGHEVTALLPMLEGVDPLSLGLARRLRPVKIELDGREEALFSYEGRTPGGVGLVVLDHEALLREAPSLETGEGPERARRALLFARSALQWARHADPPPDVLHGHGWLGALLHLEANDTLPLAWTLYDPTGHPVLVEVAATSAPDATPIDRLADAAARAGHVALPSRALAEALEEGHRYPELSARLRRDAVQLHPILHGLDEARWNPATDPLLEFHFDMEDPRGKTRAKAAMQLRLELPSEEAIPLLLAEALRQEQAAPLIESLPAVLHNEVQLLVLLGNEVGEEHAARLRSFPQRFPDRVRVLDGTSPRSVHRALGAADLFLLPEAWASTAEPAQAAQRYGALPVASLASAHADVVVDCDSALSTGTGFLFDPQEGEASLVACVQRATAAWHRREPFEALRRRVMRLDASWHRAASRYERFYRNLMEAGRPASSEEEPPPAR